MPPAPAWAHGWHPRAGWLAGEGCGEGGRATGGGRRTTHVCCGAAQGGEAPDCQRLRRVRKVCARAAADPRCGAAAIYGSGAHDCQ